MKKLNTYLNQRLNLVNKNMSKKLKLSQSENILERLKISKNDQGPHRFKYFPENLGNLDKIIENKIKEELNKDIFSHSKKIHLDLNDIDISKLDSLEMAIYGHDAIKSVDVSMWDTKNIKVFYECFSYCYSLEKIIGLENWKLDNTVNLEGLFEGCKKLKDIGDLSNWDVRKIRRMTNLFCNCEELEEIKGIEKWKTESLERLNSTFINCKKLKSIDLSNWNPKLLHYINKTFMNCTSLESIGNIDDWDSKNQMFTSTNFLLQNRMFDNCPKLKLPKWYPRN